MSVKLFAVSLLTRSPSPVLEMESSITTPLGFSLANLLRRFDTCFRPMPLAWMYPMRSGLSFGSMPSASRNLDSRNFMEFLGRSRFT